VYNYKITSLRFNEGSSLTPGQLTVLIGPNNAGKSCALRDIVELAASSRAPLTKVIQHATWTVPASVADVVAAYDVIRQRNEHGNWVYYRLRPTLTGENQTSGGMDWSEFNKYYDAVFAAGGTRAEESFRSEFGDAVIAFLTTEHRLQLVKESESASREGQSANLLQALFNRGSSLDETLNKQVRAAFGCHIKLDFTTLQRLLLRVGDDFSAIPPDPRDARAPLAKFEKLDDQGDGLRSFVGVLVAVLALNRSLFLIDEPEAFLHPPQAFRIGEFLASFATATRQIVIATHSVDVLRGILSKTKDVNIVRLDRQNNETKVRQLEPARLKALVDDPLLTSARVLDGLFYSGAIVVEADSDARFYQKACGKLRPEMDLHFVNADNKQTVPRIMSLYSEMGVVSAGIVDIDVAQQRNRIRTTA
jgi:predicted ATPase